MSYPIGRTVRACCVNGVREDLQVGQKLRGTVIGIERRHGDWGLITGEVAVLIVREAGTRDVIEVPIVEEHLSRRPSDALPLPGQLATIMSTGTAELEILVQGGGVRLDVVRDREPVLDEDASEADLVTTRA